jgi:hypothetical protein
VQHAGKLEIGDEFVALREQPLLPPDTWRERDTMADWNDTLSRVIVDALGRNDLCG